MAHLVVKTCNSLLSVASQVAFQGLQQIRTKYTNHLMVRDVKRRIMHVEYAPMRLRVNAMRKNNILPLEIRQLADAEISSYPRDSTPRRIKNRCVITSRPRGIVYKWRVSRIVFRHLADYNLLGGVQRAMW